MNDFVSSKIISIKQGEYITLTNELFEILGVYEDFIRLFMSATAVVASETITDTARFVQKRPFLVILYGHVINNFY